MASDSCVSGSEDARTPPHDKGADVAPKSTGALQQPSSQQPSSQGDVKTDDRGGAKQQPMTLKGGSGESAPPGSEADKPTARPVARPAAKPSAAAGPVPTTGPAATSQPAVAADPGAAGVTNEPAATQGFGGAPSTGEVESAPSKPDREPSKLFLAVTANHFLLFNAVPSWLVSMVVHAALLIVLALITLPERPPEKNIVAVANPTDVEDIENLASEEIDPLDVDVFTGLAPAESADSRVSTAELDVPSLDDMSAAPEQIKLEDFGEMANFSEDLLDRVGGGMGAGLGEARGAKARKGMVDKFGGSEGSEAAVAAALKWLAAHQELDGGWDFDHTRGPCKGQCRNPGRIAPSRNGATAMALLPFLGAGQTHQEGQYKETVGRGLAFLVQQMKLGNGMGDLSDSGGRLYSHGLAAITLCEAYAMTTDQALMQPAQLALNFIVYAQDPIGGGWRYIPQQAGDTSVLGWQLMACKSGHMAYLRVPRKTFLGSSKFLDFVQEQDGALYGYTVPGAGPATSAVGLLCRMYLGWKHDEPALKAGVEYLHQWGPTDDMYYNYYATQVMRHYGGQYWESWNSKMRDRLVAAQDQKGHAKGSWYFPNTAHGDQGGRLYCTSMATMILEVYYRHLPIYGKQAAEEEFPL